jgi:hypothetical protein
LGQEQVGHGLAGWKTVGWHSQTCGQSTAQSQAGMSGTEQVELVGWHSGGSVAVRLHAGGSSGMLQVELVGGQSGHFSGAAVVVVVDGGGGGGSGAAVVVAAGFAVVLDSFGHEQSLTSGHLKTLSSRTSPFSRVWPNTLVPYTRSSSFLC